MYIFSFNNTYLCKDKALYTAPPLVLLSWLIVVIELSTCLLHCKSYNVLPTQTCVISTSKL